MSLGAGFSRKQIILGLSPSCVFFWLSDILWLRVGMAERFWQRRFSADISLPHDLLDSFRVSL